MNKNSISDACVRVVCNADNDDNDNDDDEWDGKGW